MKKERLTKAQFGFFRELGAGEKSKSQENIVGINVNNELLASDLELANAFNKWLQNKEPIYGSNFEYIKRFVDSKGANKISISTPEII